MTSLSCNQNCISINLLLINGWILLLHFDFQICKNGHWNLNWCITGVHQSQFSLVITCHVYIIVKEIVHQETPFADSQIWIIIDTVYSIFDLIVINGSDLHLRSLIHIQRIFIIERYNLFLDLTIFFQLFHNGSIIISWSKSNDSISLEFSEHLSRCDHFKLLNTKLSFIIILFCSIEKLCLLILIFVFIFF